MSNGEMREDKARQTLCSQAQRDLRTFQYVGMSSSSLCKSILSGKRKGKLLSYTGGQGRAGRAWRGRWPAGLR